jgi:hypothetical protein
MALETGTNVGDLVITNPTSTDPKSYGDDHLRLVKTVLKNSFAGYSAEISLRGTEAQGSTVNDYTVTVSPAPTAYTIGTLVTFKSTHANTSTCTLQVNSLGTKSLLDSNGVALPSGAIPSGAVCQAVYDGTSFYLISANGHLTAATPTLGDSSTKIATTAFVAGTAFSSSLPAQAGNSGKFLTTDGTSASFAVPTVAINDDTTTNSDRYVTFVATNSGNSTGATVSSPKLKFNPSTGLLTTLGLNTGAIATSGSITSSSNIIDLSANTGALSLPQGTTAQRPASPVVGQSRYNTTLNQTEVWSGFTWTPLTSQTYSATYLIVAGGGGSSYGGGGAGGFLTGTTLLNIGNVYTVTVGGGGAAAVSSAAGSNGSNSSITGLTTAIGGGGGGSGSANGISGGSGGGGSVGTYTGGSGTSGQGFAGGNASSATYNAGGGGGGSNAAGTNSSGGNLGGNGGNGTSNSITGSAVTYAGGGAGVSSGGIGLGTAGTGSGSTANFGGGGTPTLPGGVPTFGAGGSGVVVISVPTANYTGTVTGSPTVTTNGSQTVIKFTSSGSYTG